MKNLSEKQLKNQKHYKSLGIAKVCSPLRHVLGKHTTVTHKIVDGKEVTSKEYDPFARMAFRAAAKGKGRLVNLLARQG